MSVFTWLLAASIVAALVVSFFSTWAFRATVLTGAVALCIVSILDISWNAPVTPLVLVKLAAFLVCAILIVTWVRQIWRIWNGLDQWPSPRGRYYDRWLTLPQEQPDYFLWLAEQKGWQEPWATWVQMDKAAREARTTDD